MLLFYFFVLELDKMSDYRNVPVYRGPVKACVFDWAGELKHSFKIFFEKIFNRNFDGILHSFVTEQLVN